VLVLDTLQVTISFVGCIELGGLLRVKPASTSPRLEAGNSRLGSIHHTDLESKGVLAW